MSVRNPYSQYLENQIITASPAKLLTMTYDAALRFGKQAQDSMKEGRLEDQSTAIRKVQNILLELISALDHSVDRQLAANLDALYTYIFDRLTRANISDDWEALEESMEILTELRSAWVQAEVASRTNSTVEVQAA